MRTNTGQHQAVGGRRKKLALNASLLLIGLSTIAASSADDPDPIDSSESHCLEVTVYYWVLDGNGEKQYVLGPDHCVLGTPWTSRTVVEREVSEDENGVGLRVSVPEPDH